jgi:hypothetical protein
MTQKLAQLCGSRLIIVADVRNMRAWEDVDVEFNAFDFFPTQLAVSSVCLGID